jgi:hypothetical protein
MKHPDSPRKDGEQRDHVVVAISAGAVVFAVWIVAWYYTLRPFQATPVDLFSSINSLFSGLAFAGVIIAILMQRQELKLQREELEATREELRRAAEAHEESRDLQRRRLYEDARYESWLRASDAIEAYRTWLSEWRGYLENVGHGGSLEDAMREWYDKRRSNLPGVLRSTDKFFPGLFSSFKFFCDGVDDIFEKADWQRGANLGVTINHDMARLCEEWRDKVHTAVFWELLDAEKENVS